MIKQETEDIFITWRYGIYIRGESSINKRKKEKERKNEGRALKDGCYKVQRPASKQQTANKQTSQWGIRCIGQADYTGMDDVVRGCYVVVVDMWRLRFAVIHNCNADLSILCGPALCGTCYLREDIFKYPQRNQEKRKRDASPCDE